MWLANGLVNLLYPPACLLCRAHPGDPDRVFCEPCAARLPRLGPPVCVRCGTGLPGAFDSRVLCGRCRRRSAAFDQARAVWWYAGPIRGAVTQFKYARRRPIGRWLAADMAEEARRSLPLGEIDAVVPVPLHWLKQRLHGFDHARELARDVARALAKPLASGALARTRWTRSQTRLRGRRRRQNVRRAFRASSGAVHERTLLLIDDVHTTGATVEACATALKAAGAHRVFVLTAARTPRP